MTLAGFCAPFYSEGPCGSSFSCIVSSPCFPHTIVPFFLYFFLDCAVRNVPIDSCVVLDDTQHSLPSPLEIVDTVQRLVADPNTFLKDVVAVVETMGPLGALYFGVIYTVAEVLALPAFPLTASAGYLFGLPQGTAVVLVSASIAAAISFVIGRTLLRSYVENLLDGYPEFQKIDKAIGKEGFKLMLLLRLSPIFPFALSNYLYGASSVRFWPFFWGTLLGFTPGTMAYVYTGEVGKALTIGDGSAQPWYVYLGGFAVLTGFIKILADVATGVIENLDEEGEDGA